MQYTDFFLPWLVEIVPQYMDQSNYDSDYISGVLK